MTHTNTEALSDAVTREDAIKFLEGACRNWSKVPKLSEDDIGDVASELLRFALSRRSASNTGGVEVKARQALAVYGKWVMDVATLGELADLEARMTAVGLTLQDVGKWSNPPSLAAEAEPVADCANEGHDHPGHDWRTACLKCGVFKGSDLYTQPSSPVSAEVTVGAGWEEHSLEEKQSVQKHAGIPHLPTDMTYEARLAVSGRGPRAYEWSDKKHRLVYDLCREIERIASINGGRENG